MRTTTFLSVTTVVLAFLIVAHSRTVGLTTRIRCRKSRCLNDGAESRQ